ncbi:MAG TPA: hypothetical protein VM779_05020, partial [Thermoanaerobaculia bacterium]|nr:hypothetical protein [Thermoanaerobaculia bacterium]
MPVYQFSPFAIPPAVSAALVMLLAIGILLTRFSRTSVAMFILAVAAAAWQTACAFLFSAVEERTALMWATAGFVSLAFVAPAAYQFVVSILPGASHRRIVSAAGWLVAAQFGMVMLTTGYFMSGVRRFWWGFHPTYDTA